MHHYVPKESWALASFSCFSHQVFLIGFNSPTDPHSHMTYQPPNRVIDLANWHSGVFIGVFKEVNRYVRDTFKYKNSCVQT